MKLVFVLAVLAVPASGLPVPTELASGAASPGPGPQAVLLGTGKNLLGGWNHIPNDSALSGVSLGREAEAYDPGAMDWQDFPDRSAVPVILVKRLADWDHQHANGLEGTWIGLNYEDLSDVVIDVRLDLARSKIPTAAHLKQRYGEWLNDGDLAALDGQKAVLRVTITGPHEAWSAETWLVIDPNTQGDRWLRFDIPIGDFVYFRGDPWNKQPLDIAELAGAPVGHLRIEPETMGNVPERWGNVVRNFRPDLWDKNTPPPETFKEIAIRLSAVYARLKGSTN
jgi:hypothetical protein